MTDSGRRDLLGAIKYRQVHTSTIIVSQLTAENLNDNSGYPIIISGILWILINNAKSKILKKI